MAPSTATRPPQHQLLPCRLHPAPRTEPAGPDFTQAIPRSEEHTSELQSPCNLVCRLLLEKKQAKPRRPGKGGARIRRYFGKSAQRGALGPREASAILAKPRRPGKGGARIR